MALQSMVLEAPLVKEVRPFAGTLAQIPAGWQLCNGTNGTPDLRDKFIRVVAVDEEAGVVGGANTHIHDAHPALTHSGGSVGAIAQTASTLVKGGTSSSVNAAAQTHTHPAPTFTQPSQHAAQSHVAGNNEPAYYKLAFITKAIWWT